MHIFDKICCACMPLYAVVCRCMYLPDDDDDDDDDLVWVEIRSRNINNN